MSSETIFFIIVVFLCLDFVLERVLESLNSKLNEESYIRELEQRLETDPLTIGGVIEMQSDVEISMI